MIRIECSQSEMIVSQFLGKEYNVKYSSLCGYGFVNIFIYFYTFHSNIHFL